MSRGFLYYFAGGKHAVQILLSIASLRKHDNYEPVCIACADDEAEGYVERFMKDERLGELVSKRIKLDLKADKLTKKHRGKGRQHCGKASMGLWTPWDKTIFLDADTLVVGDIQRLWPDEEEVILTQFSNWVTSGNRMRSRLKRYDKVLPREVAMMRAHDYPAINTGILSWDRKAERFHQRWREVALNVTNDNGSAIFMGDEITANLIFIHHKHQVFDDRYNFSVVYSPEAEDKEFPDDGTPENVRIYHFHGGKHCRPRLAWPVFYPAYKEAFDANLGGLQSWSPARDESLALALKNH